MDNYKAVTFTKLYDGARIPEILGLSGWCPRSASLLEEQTQCLKLDKLVLALEEWLMRRKSNCSSDQPCLWTALGKKTLYSLHVTVLKFACCTIPHTCLAYQIWHLLIADINFKLQVVRVTNSQGGHLYWQAL